MPNTAGQIIPALVKKREDLKKRASEETGQFL
jgi:hypothetical protein